MKKMEAFKSEDCEMVCSEAFKSEDCEMESDTYVDSIENLHSTLRQLGHVGDLSHLSKLECIRLKNVMERNALFKSLGFDVSTPTNEKKQPVPKPKRKKKSGRSTKTPVRKSLRLNKIPEPIKLEKRKRPPVKLIDDRFKDCIDLQEFKGLFTNLFDLSKISPRRPDSSIKIATCSHDLLAELMASLSLKADNVKQVVRSKVQSVLVHPTLDKRLAIAGSTTGTIGIWDVDAETDKGLTEIQIQKSSVNCLSVCYENATTIYSTSFDGTFSYLDLSSYKIVNIYCTDFDKRINHITWHHQLESKKFLLGHGNGSVLCLDARVKKPKVQVINCFKRSVRTVQTYPQFSSYFLVSSRSGECAVFDQRNGAKICDFPHDKPLASAFFSPINSTVLTTSSDDKIRIFDFQKGAKEAKVLKTIIHNNFTGRWLGAFKAKWLPGRDDVFHVGSLQQPRRIQFYSSTGYTLFDLTSENMLTVQPVIDIHHTTPFLVSGNSIGKLHAYTSRFSS